MKVLKKGRLYGRFSSLPQEKGDSYRMQVEGGQKYFQEHGIELVYENSKPAIYFDHAVSGKAGANLEKEFGRLLADVQPGEIVGVMLMDRLGRQNPILLCKLLYDLVQRDVTVIAWGEGKTITKENIEEMSTQFDVFTGAAVGNNENRRKMKRLKEVNAETFRLAAKGIPTKNLSKYLPTSFRWDEAKKSIEQVPEKARIVQRLWDMFTEQGLGKTTICQKLNTEGVPTLYAKNKTKAWLETSVKKILTNEAYAGTMTVKGHKFTCYKGIISKTQFDKAQVLIERWKKRAGNQTDRVRINNIFIQMAVCEDCGGLLTVHPSLPRKPSIIKRGKNAGQMNRPKAGTTFAFRCMNHKLRRKGKTECHCDTWRMRNSTDIEALVCSEFLHGAGETLMSKSTAELKFKRDSLIQHIEKAQVAISSLYDMVENGDPEAKTRIEKRKAEKADLEKELHVMFGIWYRGTFSPTKWWNGFKKSRIGKILGIGLTIIKFGLVLRQ